MYYLSLLTATIVITASLVTCEARKGEIQGKFCNIPKVVGSCIKTWPHYDPEGAVCANDGQDDEAYCSYGVGWYGGIGSCAYCVDEVEINGKKCKNPVSVGECMKEAPHYDPEGAACANDGQVNEAYCTYSLGVGSCAFCDDKPEPVEINGKMCNNPVSVGECMKEAPHYDPEGMVCANDGQVNEAYCTYILGDNEGDGACAFCDDDVVILV